MGAILNDIRDLYKDDNDEYDHSCSICIFRKLTKHPTNAKELCRVWYRDEVRDMINANDGRINDDKNICVLYREDK